MTNEAQGLWRDGTLLVAYEGARFPARCVKCNQMVSPNEFWKRNMAWHPAWVYATLLISPLIYIIVALVLRKQQRVNVGLCANHRGRRRNAILIGWGGFLGGTALMFYALSSGIDWLIAVSVLAGLVAIIYGMAAAQLIGANKIKDRYIYLRGVHPDYLAVLPSVGAPTGHGGGVAKDVVNQFD